MFFIGEMMRISYFSSLFIVLCFVELSLHSELLILTKDKYSGFLRALSKEESIKHGPAISQVLMKYQWPMCIASRLTKQEQNDDSQDKRQAFGLTIEERKKLLSPDQPGAEAIFIAKKLKEVVDGIELFVIFISTTLYELFILSREISVTEFATEVMISKEMNNLKYFDVMFQEDLIPYEIYKNAYKIYEDFNSLFFYNSLSFGEVPYLFYNRMVFESLLILDKRFSTMKKAPDFFALLQSESIDLMQQRIESNKNLKVRIHPSQYDILTEYIDLDYRAYYSNKALLGRGAGLVESFIDLQKEAQKEKLIGSTILTAKIERDLVYTHKVVGDTETAAEIFKKYKNREIMPFSISFGASLFAGYLFDKSACVWTYFIKNEDPLTLGYVLFVNKFDYYDNQCMNLFFIPPLANISSLFAQGEFFHPRVKAAILEKSLDEQIKVEGILYPLFDKAGMFLITRDPLKHAKIFSDFLVENGELFFKSKNSINSKKINESIKIAQKKASEFYQDIKKAKLAIPIVEKKIKDITDKKHIAPTVDEKQATRELLEAGLKSFQDEQIAEIQALSTLLEAEKLKLEKQTKAKLSLAKITKLREKRESDKEEKVDLSRVDKKETGKKNVQDEIVIGKCIEILKVIKSYQPVRAVSSADNDIKISKIIEVLQQARQSQVKPVVYQRSVAAQLSSIKTVQNMIDILATIKGT